MSRQPENPRAFPVHPGIDLPENEGMTLRDWFAGQALAGLCTLLDPVLGAIKYDVIASDAYNQADAMLAERER